MQHSVSLLMFLYPEVAVQGKDTLLSGVMLGLWTACFNMHDNARAQPGLPNEEVCEMKDVKQEFCPVGRNAA